MIDANGVFILGLGLLSILSWYCFRATADKVTAMLYLSASLLTILLAGSVVDSIAAVTLNAYKLDFFFLDSAFLIVLPILFFLVNTFFLYEPSYQPWRFWFGLPIAIFSAFAAVMLLFFILIGLFSFDSGAGPIIITCLVSAVLITTVIAFVTEALYPTRYQLYQQKVVALFHKAPVLVVILLVYLGVIAGHGLIRQRELVFSRVMYERYKTVAVGMSVAEFSQLSQMQFNQLEEGDGYQYWYSCAQPQIWRPCRGLRLYVDKQTGQITQVQARGPLVGQSFIYGFDYGQWLVRAFTLRFQGLDSYAGW